MLLSILLRGLHLQNLDDFELGVHDQYVLFLWFCLSFDCVSIGAVVQSRGKETPSSQDYLGH